MSLTIALDGMGGDDAPQIVIEGAALALREVPDLRFLLFGDETRLRPLVAARPVLEKACELRHTDEFVAGDAKPSAALRQARNSSMRLAINAVKDGEAAAAVSAGNTGALMAMAMFVLKTLPGIDRPALATAMPTRRKPVIILDLGANVECDADHLFQFAVMGEVVARTLHDIAQPTVGLLNVGVEEVKGDDVVRKAAAMLRDTHLQIGFAGFVEGNDIAAGSVDVVVTDGFTGNVALKVAEGTVGLFADGLKEAFRSSLASKLAWLLARPALQRLRDRFDARRYNGAMFLGVNGVVVKSHGGTDALGFSAAVKVAANLARQDANRRIIDEMSAVQAALEPDSRMTASRATAS